MDVESSITSELDSSQFLTSRPCQNPPRSTTGAHRIGGCVWKFQRREKSLAPKGIRTPDLPASSVLAIRAATPDSQARRSIPNKIKRQIPLKHWSLSVKRTWLYIRPNGRPERTSVLLRTKDVLFFHIFPNLKLGRVFNSTSHFSLFHGLQNINKQPR